MKKSSTIAKMLLKSALAAAGCVAFLFLVGEPSDEWLESARKTFGWFAFGWFIIEKVLAGLAIYLLYKVSGWIGPVLPEEDVEPEAVEE